MPVIDTELIEPLTAITDTLLKRPGVVTMQSIKRLSEMYGFTTFVEYIKGSAGGQNMVRLSISGLILLIDVDFSIPSEMQNSVGSPMSPSVGTNVNSIGVLPNTCIQGVSISSAITPEEIDGKSYDFLFGFSGFPSCSDVLFSNLKEKTLDSFNMNLRVLLQFDRLSKNKPDDWFTMFTELVWGLNEQARLERKHDEHPDEAEWADGVCGVGRVLANQNNKVGLFLQYWVDDRYTNRWIRENKGLDVVDRVYTMHFKVKESVAFKGMNQFSTETDNVEEAVNGGGDGEGDAGGVSGNEQGALAAVAGEAVDDDGDVVMEKNDSASTMGGTDADAAAGDGGSGSSVQGRLFDAAQGRWKTEHGTGASSGSTDDRKPQDNFSLVVLELCPPVWVPEDVVSLGGVDYEVINDENENWSDNHAAETSADRALARLYAAVNRCPASGCVELARTKVDVLVGCKMVRLFKVQLADMNRLRELVRVLRSWCKVNSALRKLATGVDSVSVTDDSDEPAVALDDLFADPPAPPASPVAAAAPDTVVAVRAAPISVHVRAGPGQERGGEVIDGRASEAVFETAEALT